MIAKTAVELHEVMVRYIRERLNGANIYHQDETKYTNFTLDYLDRLVDKKPIRV